MRAEDYLIQWINAMNRELARRPVLLPFRAAEQRAEWRGAPPSPPAAGARLNERAILARARRRAYR